MAGWRDSGWSRWAMVSFRRALGLLFRLDSGAPSPIAPPELPAEDVLRKEGAELMLTGRCFPLSASRRDVPEEQTGNYSSG